MCPILQETADLVTFTAEILNGKLHFLSSENTHINNDKSWKMSSIVELRLLILKSLKYSTKGESPINRSAKALISSNLTTSQHNHLLFFFYLFLIFLNSAILAYFDKHY